MNVMNPYLKEYKKNQIETATPEQILILLYDGAIQFLNKAKIAFEANDLDTFSKNIFSCEKILIEFMNTLDMELGGDFARTLYELYRYYYKTLVNANVTKNVSKIDEILKHLTNLRETWQKAIDMVNSEKNTVLAEEEDKEQIQSFDSSDDEDEDYIDKYDSDEDDEEE